MLKKHPCVLAFIFFTEMLIQEKFKQAAELLREFGAEWMGRPQKDIFLVK
jgi:hypothetical protein